MLVAISQRNDLNNHGDSIDNLENNYISYLEKFGITLLIIPNKSEKIESYFEKFPIEGVILSGGNDIDPTYYGSERKENLSLALNRDKVEKKMLEIAVEKKLPVLGICRGMQFINVFYGGKIIDLKTNFLHPPAQNHQVVISEEYCEWLGNLKEINSYHNQGITKEELSLQLKPFAISEKEGIVEGFYHPTLSIVGIQWHPERKSPDEEFNIKLIKAFVNRESFWEK